MNVIKKIIILSSFFSILSLYLLGVNLPANMISYSESSNNISNSTTVISDQNFEKSLSIEKTDEEIKELPDIKQKLSQLIKNKSNLVYLLADIIEGRLNEVINVLQVTSLDDSLRSVKYLSNVTKKDMGIPEYFENSKREIAENILLEHPDFGSIFFVLPNGDIYLGEPYLNQKQLPRLNYADRDWYKGISKLKNITITGTLNDIESYKMYKGITDVKDITSYSYYVSDVFLSASIHVPATGIAVPIFSNHENKPEQIIGYWVGILNLDKIQQNLNRLTLDKSDRIIIFDHNAASIVDTWDFNSNSTKQLKSFKNIESVKRALDGKSGAVIETLNGVRVLSVYEPIKAGSHNWGIVYHENLGNIYY